MKLHKYSITGLFFFIFLFACHRDSDKTSLLHRADSLMQEFPDSALAILRFHMWKNCLVLIGLIMQYF